MYIDSEIIRDNGQMYEVLVRSDDETEPMDFDTYDDVAVAAWRRGDWRYVTVTVRCRGVEASISGVEWGELPPVNITLESLITGEYMTVTDTKTGASTTYTLINSLMTECDEIRAANEEES